MSWYKTAQETTDLHLYEDCYDSYQGESFCRIIAENNNGDILGILDFSYCQGEIDIKNIEVLEEYRRQGIGTKMLEFLKSDNSDCKINYGLATDLGFKFLSGLRNKGFEL